MQTGRGKRQQPGLDGEQATHDSHLCPLECVIQRDVHTMSQPIKALPEENPGKAEVPHTPTYATRLPATETLSPRA